MKKLFAPFLATLFLFGAQYADAADCRYQTNSTDKFTKVVTQWTKWNELMSGWTRNFRRYSPIISVHAIDGEVQLLLKIEYFRQKKDSPALKDYEDVIYVVEGAPLLIMMADNSIIKLLALSEVRTDAYTISPEEQQSHDSNMYYTKATAVIKYALDAGAVEALTRQSAARLRLTMVRDDFDFEIHKKSVDDLSSAVRCVS